MEELDVNNVFRVSRNPSGRAPEHSLFPDNPNESHEWFCEFDPRTYQCSCGLTERQLERGDFVKYHANMSMVVHPEPGSFPSILSCLPEFLKELAKRSANVNMKFFKD